jgi:hypothetical protein
VAAPAGAGAEICPESDDRSTVLKANQELLELSAFRARDEPSEGAHTYL